MLYVVATPIGNLSDLSDRARTVLKSVDYIACEDTRHSGNLLKQIGVNAKLLSLHAHSGTARVEQIINRLSDGRDVALVSDAGTPGISDPGAVLIKAAHQIHHPVSPIPGPSAVAAALSVCGFDTNRFRFIGFLPKKKGRLSMLKEIAEATEPVVLFESPHRIAATLEDFHGILIVTRQVCICRELTKKFEEVLVGSISELKKHTVRAQGEFVLVVDAKE